jgi:hypothetical protein
MSQYTIVNESTEDTLETADNLPDAVRLARQAAKRGTVSDLVSVLDGDGKSVGQFVLLPDGTVQEQPVTPANQPIDASRS